MLGKRIQTPLTVLLRRRLPLTMLLLWLAATAAALAQQTVPRSANEIALAELAGDVHTTLRHPSYPRYSVRVKRVEGFCETTTAKYVLLVCS